MSSGGNTFSNAQVSALKKLISNIGIALFSSFYVFSILLRQSILILLRGYIILFLSSSFDSHIEIILVSIAIAKIMTTSKIVVLKPLKPAWYLLLGLCQNTESIYRKKKHSVKIWVTKMQESFVRPLPIGCGQDEQLFLLILIKTWFCWFIMEIRPKFSSSLLNTGKTELWVVSIVLK